MMCLRTMVGVFCLGLFLVSCSKDRTQEMIIGNWELEDAFRQGRPTSTLDGLQFTFTDDSLYTNMTVFENHGYEYAHDTLTILASHPFTFYVFSIDSVELQLHGEIQNVKFRMQFAKIKP